MDSSSGLKLEGQWKEKIAHLITAYPDFPKKGVLFRDLHPVMLDPDSRQAILDYYTQKYRGKIDVVVGLESRGYYFGIPLAFALKLPFVPLRKAGKLPGEVESVSFGKEYGKDELQVQRGAIKKQARVLILDDLLATGGTAAAACTLVQNVGAQIVAVEFQIELLELKGREKQPPNVEYHSLFQM